MSSYISRGIFIFCLMALCGQAFAAVGDCDILKTEPDPNAHKSLYGLCVAYWSAENGVGQERVRILYEKKAEGSLYPKIPGTVPSPTTCPCWDFDALVQTIACKKLPLTFPFNAFSWGEGTFDGAWFTGNLQIYAGNTWFFPDSNNENPELTQCDVVNAVGGDFMISPTALTDEMEDLVCREQVLNLIANTPTFDEDCLTP